MRELARVLAKGEPSEPRTYLRAYHLAGVLARSIAWAPIPLWWLLQGFRSDKHMPGWHRYV